MAPSNQNQNQIETVYVKDERVLCFHHEFLYEAKVLESKPSDPNDKKSPLQYRVHYKGWKNTWDDWVPSDRLRKYTEENKELAQNLKKEMDALRHRPAPKATASTKKKNAGSDLSSTRGSEERHSSVPVTGRGQKRGRDFEIEKVGDEFSMRCMSEPLPGSTIGLRISNEGGSGSSGSSTRPSSPPTPAVNIKRPIFYDGAADSPERPSVAPEETASASDLSTPPASPSAGPGGPEAPNEDAVAASPGGAATVAKRAKKTSATRKTKIQPTSRKTRGRPAGVGPEDVVKVKIEELEAQSPAKRQRGPKGLKTLPQSQPQPQLLNPEPEGDEVTPKTALKTVLNPDPNVACKDPCCKCKCHSAKLSGPKQEDAFMNKLAVKIPIPDNLKNILVDDWEQVTKNQSLVPVPVPCPVNDLLDLYQADEIKNRCVGSAEYDILQETVHGLKEYFANCLGKVLLYKLERIQYYEMRACWEGSIKEWEGKGPGDVYGAEHLIRLWSSMPELIAQTNMDQQSVNRIREEFTKLAMWISKNANRIFTVAYEPASAEYIERSKMTKD